ncbi:MAG: hypothetical protein EZS28_050363, partial [Streblomastix strix]
SSLDDALLEYDRKNFFVEHFHLAVARILDPFNIRGVNKQSKRSLSLQEVVYNPEEYKQFSGRGMSSSFVPPHQDVPTLGNLLQTESSEVQTTNSADEMHEAQMKKEKETDDS